MDIGDLPEEVLSHILRHLDRYDRQSLMLVSRLWSTVVFELCASTTVLKIFTSEEAFRGFEKTANLKYNLDETLAALLTSRRWYRNILLVWEADKRNQEIILNVLSRFSSTVVSLKMHSCGCETDLNWLTSVLGLFRNLRHLDVDGVGVEEGTPNGISKFIHVYPMYSLHTLLDKHQVVAFVRDAQDVFANITTLSVRLTKKYPLKHLLHELSPTLVHLTLNMSLKLFELYSDEQFPSLETFELFGYDGKIETSIDHLSRFVLNAPKLKNLKLRARIDLSILSRLNPFFETLENLAIYVDTLTLGVLLNIQKFSNIKRLWIGVFGKPMVRLTGLNNVLPMLTSVRSLILECNEKVPVCDKFYHNCFPNLTELQLQFADPDQYCLRIVNEIPSLRILIIRNPYYEAELTHFVFFCHQLEVPEVHLHCFKMRRGQWNPALVRRVLNLQKLVINAALVDPGVYEPMLILMPALKSLQLALEYPCANHTMQNLSKKFPQCHVTRVLRPKLFLTGME